MANPTASGVLVFVLLAGTLVAACGDNSSSAGVGTPAGTYRFTVTGIVGSVTQTIQFAVVVQ